EAERDVNGAFRGLAAGALVPQLTPHKVSDMVNQDDRIHHQRELAEAFAPLLGGSVQQLVEESATHQQPPALSQRQNFRAAGAFQVALVQNDRFHASNSRAFWTQAAFSSPSCYSNEPSVIISMVRSCSILLRMLLRLSAAHAAIARSACALRPSRSSVKGARVCARLPDQWLGWKFLLKAASTGALSVEASSRREASELSWTASPLFTSTMPISAATSGARVSGAARTQSRMISSGAHCTTGPWRDTKRERKPKYRFLTGLLRKASKAAIGCSLKRVQAMSPYSSPCVL